MNLAVDKFNPLTAKIAELKAKAAGLTLDNPEDKEQVDLIKGVRIELRDVRVAITKIGKELREDAIATQKAVIAKEKELVAEIEPEEDRLQAMEDEAKKLAERKRREKVLPTRREFLTTKGLEASDEQLLDMDDEAFNSFVNTEIEARNERERQALEAERKRIEEEKAAMEREKEMRDREEKARQEERERAAAEATRKERERVEREAREKQEAEKREQERIAREAEEKAAAEKKAQEERERLEKQEKYRAFRSAHGWTEDKKADFREENTGTEIVLWHKVGSFTL